MEKLKVIYDWNFEDMGGDGGVLEGVEKSGKYKWIYDNVDYYRK